MYIHVYIEEWEERSCLSSSVLYSILVGSVLLDSVRFCALLFDFIRFYSMLYGILDYRRKRQYLYLDKECSVHIWTIQKTWNTFMIKEFLTV